jgi:hypothetical protein
MIVVMPLKVPFLCKKKAALLRPIYRVRNIVNDLLSLEELQKTRHDHKVANRYNPYERKLFHDAIAANFSVVRNCIETLSSSKKGHWLTGSSMLTGMP